MSVRRDRKGGDCDCEKTFKIGEKVDDDTFYHEMQIVGKRSGHKSRGRAWVPGGRATEEEEQET